LALSKRLKALSEYYDHQSIIWDIGCDHGLLGSSFQAITSVREIHLVDPSVEVIKFLTDAYITNPSSKIHIHQQHGQNLKINHSSNCIFIAGMGGKEILEISLNIIPQLTAKDLLIVSPHRKILELRAYLKESILNLVEEKLIWEDGQYYQIFCLSLDPKYSKISLYGDDIWKGDTGRKYHSHQLEAFLSHQDGMGKAYTTFLKELNP